MNKQQTMEAIVAEIFRQSKMRSDAADAPEVWQLQDDRFLHIDGAVNMAGACARDQRSKAN
jgi:hypothetical protein